MATKTVILSDVSEVELDENTHVKLAVELPGDIRYTFDVSSDEIRNWLGEAAFQNGQQFVPAAAPHPKGHVPRGYYREIMSKFDASDSSSLVLTCPTNQSYSSFYQGFYSKKDFFQDRVQVQMNSRNKTVALVKTPPVEDE